MAEEKKARKPRARSYAVVMGAIDERLAMLAEAATPETVASSVLRLRELIDEAKRAVNGRGGDEEA